MSSSVGTYYDRHFLKIGESLYRVSPKNISHVFFESPTLVKVFVSIEEKTVNYEVVGSREKVIKILPSKYFSQVHENYIVHIDKVVKIDLKGNLLTLQDEIVIPTNPEYIKTFMMRFDIHE